MPNHLADQTSPYLLQHAENPVDWYPWSGEALTLARSQDKPIFLSIGYSACHWCHVMERESFTDPETASLLNRHFVSIKVDREERPDLDAIYMEAVTALTGRGGWPLSAWLTPEGVPFYGGTYFPDSPRFGMPSFRQVLNTIADLWEERRSDLEEAAAQIRERLDGTSPVPPGSSDAPLDPEVILARSLRSLDVAFDDEHGGWGGAPKFPAPMLIEALLARFAPQTNAQVELQLEKTLDAMAAGGIYDHVGGGFHRYSTDDRWLVPHFEKMLYDNAQLSRCYVHAWQVTGRVPYRRVAEQTLDYLLRDLRHPAGGFYSAEDADSEGREGAFYVWTPDEIRSALSPESAEVVMRTYGVTESGDFEGASILHLDLSADARAGEAGLVSDALGKLRATREKRARPARDEKVLVGWNGLALAALAEAAVAFGSTRYLQSAETSGAFLLGELSRPEGRLYHTWKDGAPGGNGFLDDYACLAEGLLALYQATFSETWFSAARDLVDAMLRYFRRPAGGFYDTSSDHETLIIRPRSLQDSPTPSGNAMAATVLLKMAAYTGEGRYREVAEETLANGAAWVERAPMVFGQWLTALRLVESGLTEVTIVGPMDHATTRGLLEAAAGRYRPATIVAAGPSGVRSVVPLLGGRALPAGSEAAAWVCHRETCSAPATDAASLIPLLDRSR